MSAAVGAARADVEVTLAWRYSADTGACEIACYAAETEQLFVTVGTGVDVVEARSGRQVGSHDRPDGYHPTSIAYSRGRLAVAWAADDKRQRGQIGVYRVEPGKQPREARSFDAGYLPDMLTFSPDGRFLVVANEGEPTDDYSFDPPGSITVIDTSEGLEAATAREATFTAFNSQRDELRARGVRIFGPSSSRSENRRGLAQFAQSSEQMVPDPLPNSGSRIGQATVAEDLEPEYIAICPDSRRAWVSLQENNALAEVNLADCRVEAIHPLGAVDFGRPAATLRLTGLDVSDADGGPRIRHWPVLGLYQPDGIALVTHDDGEYLLTANEGDPRRYSGFDERCPAGQLADRGLALDERLKARLLLADDQLGRLEVSTATGDADGDGDFDALHAFGTRSFSVWRIDGRRPPVQVFDSGHEFEWVTAHEAADRFNSDCGPGGALDERSPQRGPEPESVAVCKVGNILVAAIGLERTGGAMLYDVTDPAAPVFLKYIPALSQDGVSDCSPEGVLMIAADASPTGKALLVLCHEVSGTMTVYTLE